MVIRISGIPNDNFSHQGYGQQQHQHTPEVHYYQPEESKEKVKEDFGMKLDKEIEKLTIDIIL